MKISVLLNKRKGQNGETGRDRETDDPAVALAGFHGSNTQFDKKITF